MLDVSWSTYQDYDDEEDTLIIDEICSNSSYESVELQVSLDILKDALECFDFEHNDLVTIKNFAEIFNIYSFEELFDRPERNTKKNILFY